MIGKGAGGILLLLLAVPATCNAADLTVSGAITISTPSTYDNVTVTSTGLLTLSAPLTVSLNMTIQSGGVVTHAVRDTAGLVLNVTGTLNVQSGGLIDVSGKGLLGGLNGSAFSKKGETFDSNGAIVAGAGEGPQTGAGGSYGGIGGNASQGGVTNQAYGWIENPRYLGSGGERVAQAGMAVVGSASRRIPAL